MGDQTIAIVRGTIILVGAAVLVGWLMVRSVRNAERPRQMLYKWLCSLPLFALAIGAVPLFLRIGLGLLGFIVMAICASILSYLWTPHIGEVIAKPITSMFDGGSAAPELRPLYSVAQALQKRGRYVEAILEIRKQLERFPTDLEGQMLLAQIQAEDVQDLPAAELTIRRLCEQPGHAPANIAFALYSLADWHLQFGPNREAAQRALEQVIALLPGTEFALTAAHRIAHLADAEMLLSPHQRRTFAVPEGPRHLGVSQTEECRKPVAKDPGQLAQEYVSHLEKHPLDSEAREQLAVLYADHYSRLDLATDQLEQMIQHPQQPARLVVRWLNLLADLQIRCGQDYATVRQTLQRIIDRDPRVAAAETARKRIDLLRLELKAREKNPGVQLGNYEQNLGLKQNKVFAARNPGRRQMGG